MFDELDRSVAWKLVEKERLRAPCLLTPHRMTDLQGHPPRPDWGRVRLMIRYRPSGRYSHTEAQVEAEAVEDVHGGTHSYALCHAESGETWRHENIHPPLVSGAAKVSLKWTQNRAQNRICTMNLLQTPFPYQMLPEMTPKRLGTCYFASSLIGSVAYAHRKDSLTHLAMFVGLGAAGAQPYDCCAASVVKP